MLKQWLLHGILLSLHNRLNLHNLQYRLALWLSAWKWSINWAVDLLKTAFCRLANRYHRVTCSHNLGAGIVLLLLLPVIWGVTLSEECSSYRVILRWQLRLLTFFVFTTIIRAVVRLLSGEEAWISCGNHLLFDSARPLFDSIVGLLRLLGLTEPALLSASHSLVLCSIVCRDDVIWFLFGVSGWLKLVQRLSHHGLLATSQ